MRLRLAHTPATVKIEFKNFFKFGNLPVDLVPWVFSGSLSKELMAHNAPGELYHSGGTVPEKERTVPMWLKLLEIRKRQGQRNGPEEKPSAGTLFRATPGITCPSGSPLQANSVTAKRTLPLQ
jgi:hypothetical protein